MQKWENLEKSIKKHEDEKESEQEKNEKLRVELEEGYIKLVKKR